MQKMTLLIVALLLTSYTYAQKGLEFGLQFTPGTSWIINDEDFAEGDNLNFRASFGYNFGLTVGYNFTDGIGLCSGLIYSQTRQNYINANSADETVDQDRFSRTLSYLRVPVLLRFNGDLSSQTSAFFRIGPHFDFLTGAMYEYEDVESDAPFDNLVDLSDSYSLNPYEGTFNTFDDVYQNMVVGVTLEMGGIARVSDYAGIVFMLHLEGSLTNTEGEDAGQFFPSSSSGARSQAFNVMAGFTVGFNYVLSFD